MLFSTSNTGPVLEHMATSLTSLFPTRQALSNLLNQGSNFLGSSPSYPRIESNNQTPSVMYFLLIAPKLDLAAADSSQSCSSALPCSDSHFVGTASHDLMIPQDNAESFPCQ